MSDEQVGRRSTAVDVTSTSWTLGTTAGAYAPVGIHCNAAATITGALVGDASESAWVLPIGFTPLAFKSINTSSTTKTGMRIIFRR